MVTPEANLSPFDANMAIDAGWEHCLAYNNLELAEISGLTQDAIFSRGPKGVRRTGMFVGGRDQFLAMDMLDAARRSMVPPFEISVFADPSGAFTTAAGMIACVEDSLSRVEEEGLANRKVLVFGGTGPVGSVCGTLASRAGADVSIVSHESLTKANEVAQQCNERFGTNLEGADGSNDGKIHTLLADAEVVFGAAKAGIQVLNAGHLQYAARLLVACDVNAVPPEGIEGVGVTSSSEPLEARSGCARAIGALAVGNVKYKAQQALLKQMLTTETPVYLHFDHALEAARGNAGS
ncbi:NAD(P)-dependent methylenetetrahydromethanopterin dehydrogenase [Thioalkalivibrio sp. ALJ9]|uniref:NAD(P)-dependent methylenetetrahydromethanopterin dehydrogenase n=1 Tax=Thioalkalivibrio sp. ALJ9 TaxID=1158758 RepID=UPI00035F87AB|nr:NAD(P)-dependent methylenetetrahydromethanopterin dehydrogenase [Thioalkalivibrio sp. ALJ9]